MSSPPKDNILLLFILLTILAMLVMGASAAITSKLINIQRENFFHESPEIQIPEDVPGSPLLASVSYP